MTMMFEVADLAVASPATVSRCGMVYLEPGYIGLEPFVKCWLNNCPPGVNREELKLLFDKYMEPAIDWMRRNVKEIVGSVNGNLGMFPLYQISIRNRLFRILYPNFRYNLGLWIV